MKIRTTLDWKSLRFQLASKGFKSEQLEIIKNVLDQYKEELKEEKERG